MEFGLVNVSINSKPGHPPGRPLGFARPHCPGVGFSPNFLCPEGRGFELEKFSTVLKEKYRDFWICFKETGGSLKSRCSCAVSYQFLQKQYMSTVSLITWTIFGHFAHFDKIFRSSKVISANPRSSSKF